jgi:DNA repair exonuclease SbcCD ATPase subunit
MRLLTLGVSAIALLTVSVLAVGHLRLKKDHAETKRQLKELREAIAQLEEEEPRYGSRPRDYPMANTVPRLVPVPLPSPAATPAPAAKEEIQQAVAAQLATEREQERTRRAERRAERDRRARERIATRLELSPEEGQRFEATLSTMQQEWRALMEPVRSGESTFAEVRPLLDALAERTQTALQALLGTERFAKLKEMEAGPPHGPGEGGGRWLFGLTGSPPPRGPMPPAP